MYNPTALHFDAATLADTRAQWADNATVDGMANARALSRDLATIAAAKPDFVTLHPVDGGVVAAWSMGLGTITRTLSGVDGSTAVKVTIAGGAFALLATMVKKLVADDRSEFTLSTLAKNASAWTPNPGASIWCCTDDDGAREAWQASGSPDLTPIKRAPLTLKAGRFSATINTETRAPVALPMTQSAHKGHALDAAAFRTALAGAVTVAKRADSGRDYLQAVQIKPCNGGFIVQASCGHQLVNAWLNTDSPVAPDARSMVLSLQQAVELQHQIKDATRVSVHQGDDAMVFDTGSALLSFTPPPIDEAARQIDFTRVMPQGTACTVTTKAGDLQTALGLAMTGHKGSGARYAYMVLDATAHELTLSRTGNAYDVSLAKSAIPCMGVVDGDGALTVNPAYLETALKGLPKSAAVTVYLFADSALLVTPHKATVILGIRNEANQSPSGQTVSSYDVITSPDHYEAAPKPGAPCANKAKLVKATTPAPVPNQPVTIRRLPRRFAGASSVAMLIAA